jgi:hypothetical protein
MRETQIPIGQLVAAIGGVLLIVSLGLDWYGRYSGFNSFEVWDLVLVVLGIVAIASFARAVGVLPVALRSGTDLVVGAVALVIVLTQLVNHPPVGFGRDVETGLWLGLGGSALMLAGAILATARIALSIEPRGRGATVTSAGPPPGDPPPRRSPPPAPDEEPTIRSEPPPPPPPRP